MSEILFRGKTTSKGGKHDFNNVWVEGDLITSGGKYYIHPKSNRVRVEGELGKLIVMHEVVPETVGQFIGSIDKDQKKIFEGDVLRVDCGLYGTFEMYCVDIMFEWPFDEDKIKEVEIIGNIHDNPELWEVRV